MNNSHQTGAVTRVYLVRHGETAWNLERRFQGHLDVPLSAVGLEQARAVASWLAEQGVGFAALYSSDLARAAQTARVIGERLRLTPVYSERLREVHGGEWQGLLVEEVEARYPGQMAEWHRKIDSFIVPGGESIPSVQERIFAFYEAIVDKHKGEAVVLVSHGAALAALIAAIHGWDLVNTWHTKRARMGNTAVTVIEIDSSTGKSATPLFNSSSHLSEPTSMGSVLDARTGMVAP